MNSTIIKRGDEPKMHVHEHDEVVSVVEGQVTVYAGAVAQSLSSGATFLIPAGTPHTIGVDSGEARVSADTLAGGAAVGPHPRGAWLLGVASALAA